MQLKPYQQTAIVRLNACLRAFQQERAKAAQVLALGIQDYDWDGRAFKEATHTDRYMMRRSGHGQRVPYVCFKVPTGGGKTLLAARAVGDILAGYFGAQTGLVLWIVPSTQIYNQTVQALKDRAHPYRQQLELASANRVRILEKDDPFTPQDVRENLCVLMLMLPSANRQNKETLRLFKDRSGFEAFFPQEDDFEAHAALLKAMPNLDTLGEAGEFTGQVARASLGNALRVLNPVIVLDEGHKAYGATAQNTLLGFNPTLVLELTATPTEQSNVIANIGGNELLREGMIKMDVHIRNKAGSAWQDTLVASHQERLRLEQVAQDHYRETGVYIRPICLIQVERTGDKQRTSGLIHAEEVREYLIQRCNVLPEYIAVKSSEKDEIENIDLLSPECPICYIITKQALQEGWDCSFAYILTMLTNTKAVTGVTQLIGRVLRQPYAQKTGKPDLDECYVYCFKDSANEVAQGVRRGLMDEGLGDLAHRVVTDGDSATQAGWVFTDIREQFRGQVGKVYLPCFVVRDGNGSWRQIRYETDVLSQVDWSKIDPSVIDQIQLNPQATQDSALRVNLSEYTMLDQLRVVDAPLMLLDQAYITRQLLDVIPSPWHAYEIAGQMLMRLLQRYPEEIVQRDLAFAITETKKRLNEQRDRLARQGFDQLIKSEALRFILIEGFRGNSIPAQVHVNGAEHKLRNNQDQDLQRSLFEYREDEFNEMEKQVALYLDEQSWVVAWHRNEQKTGYGVQGWKPHVVYNDFIVFAQQFEKVFVLETKGLHLKGNEDTDYKRELFELCDRLSKPRLWSEIKQEFAEHHPDFRVIFEDEWKQVINTLASE